MLWDATAGRATRTTGIFTANSAKVIIPARIQSTGAHYVSPAAWGTRPSKAGAWTLQPGDIIAAGDVGRDHQQPNGAAGHSGGAADSKRGRERLRQPTRPLGGGPKIDADININTAKQILTDRGLQAGWFCAQDAGPHHSQGAGPVHSDAARARLKNTRIIDTGTDMSITYQGAICAVFILRACDGRGKKIRDTVGRARRAQARNAKGSNLSRSATGAGPLGRAHVGGPEGARDNQDHSTKVAKSQRGR